jgi:uncharacterized protein (DUF58 family)
LKNALLDPVVVAQLGNLHVRARRILDGLYAGHHTNKNRGHSQDFSEHRPYNPGDDLRSLDWKIYGRTDRLVIKQFEEQTNVGAVLALDTSGSRGFAGPGRISKFDYMKTMAAALAYVVVSQNDAVGIVTQERRLPPSAEKGQLAHVVNELDALRAAGQWDLSSLAHDMYALTRRKSFLILISDLMMDPDAALAALRALAARKHELMVLQVLDPAELNLDFAGEIEFEDTETHARLLTDADALRAPYKAWVEQRLAQTAQSFRSAGVDYQMITTDTPFDQGLGAFLAWRETRP